MIGLLYKEIYTLKNYLKSYAAVLFMFLFISIYMKSASYLQSMMTMCLGMLVFTGMSYDKMYGWDKMVLTMPVSRKMIVLSKYIASAIMGVIALIISTVAGAIVAQFFPMEEDSIMVMAVTGIILIGVLLLVYSIVLPLIYRYGVERARVFMIAAIMIPVFLIIALSEYVPIAFVEYLNAHAALSSIIFIGAALICYIISYCISYSIYNKKEY